MAKKQGKSALADFAEDLGKLLGTTERKASEWLGQRKVLATQLTQVRDRADRLLRQLTGGAADMAVAVGVARGSRGPGKKRGRKKPMTAAEKKAVSQRMKAYWAARRKTGKKTSKKAMKRKSTDSGGAISNA